MAKLLAERTGSSEHAPRAQYLGNGRPQMPLGQPPPGNRPRAQAEVMNAPPVEELVADVWNDDLRYACARRRSGRAGASMVDDRGDAGKEQRMWYGAHC